MTADTIKRPAPYRIKDLVRLTGITKQTIHYYITEGLLPKAKKTSKNMAWYGDEHVDRLRMIKELQEKQFLPLKAIKAVLTDAKDYAFTPGQQRTIEAVQQRMSVEQARTGQNWISLAELQARYGITDNEVADLERTKQLHVDHSAGAPRVEAEDEAFFRIWRHLRDIGFTPENGFSPADMEVFEHVAALMFDQGVRLLTEKIDTFDPDEAVKMINGAVPGVNELVGLFFAKKVRQFLTDFKGKS